MSENLRSALITGGKGFIGGHLTNQLEKRGYQVDSFDSSEGKDVTDRELVLSEINGYDVLFHLAGVLGPTN